MICSRCGTEHFAGTMCHKCFRGSSKHLPLKDDYIIKRLADRVAALEADKQALGEMLDTALYDIERKIVLHTCFDGKTKCDECLASRKILSDALEIKARLNIPKPEGNDA